MATWRVGAARDLSIAQTDRPWDGDGAKARIFSWAGWPDNPDPDKAKRCFLVYNADEPELKGSYKLPFADIIDNQPKAIPSGLRAAASRLPQADIPQEVKDRARTVLDGYFEKMKEMQASEFFFATYEMGKPIEVLRTGTFTDKFGREVVITEQDLEEIVRNFTSGVRGQEIPIDIEHRKEEAAGWVKRLWVAGGKLLAEVDWNSLGKKLVGEGIYRYVSATLRKPDNVLYSISLVNFPAVKGLKPVELSEGALTYEEMNALERLVEAAKALEAAVSRIMAGEGEGGEQQFKNGELPDEHNEEVNEMSTQPETPEVNVAELEAQLREQLQAEMQERLEAELREREEKIRQEYELREQVKAIVAELCSGDYGLGAQEDEVREVLMSIPDAELREKVVKLLKAKVVEFRERGSAGEGQLDNTASAAEQMDAKVRELMEKKDIDYVTAYAKAAQLFPELAAAYLLEEG